MLARAKPHVITASALAAKKWIARRCPAALVAKFHENRPFCFAFAVGQCLGQFWPMLPFEKPCISKLFRITSKSSYFSVYATHKPQWLITFWSKPNLAPQALPLDLLLRRQPEEFFRTDRNRFPY